MKDDEKTKVKTEQQEPCEISDDEEMILDDCVTDEETDEDIIYDEDEDDDDMMQEVIVDEVIRDEDEESIHDEIEEDGAPDEIRDDESIHDEEDLVVEVLGQLSQDGITKVMWRTKDEEMERHDKSRAFPFLHPSFSTFFGLLTLL